MVEVKDTKDCIEMELEVKSDKDELKACPVTFKFPKVHFDEVAKSYGVKEQDISDFISEYTYDDTVSIAEAYKKLGYPYSVTVQGEIPADALNSYVVDTLIKRNMKEDYLVISNLASSQIKHNYSHVSKVELIQFANDRAELLDDPKEAKMLVNILNDETLPFIPTRLNVVNVILTRNDEMVKLDPDHAYPDVDDDF